MKRKWGWALIIPGVLLDAAVLLLPLTRFPVIQMVFDRDYYEAQRGYEHFQKTGKWEAGDRGFALIRQHYMQDVVRGLRPELAPEVMPGTSLITFQLAPEETPGGPPEKRKVYIIYSNRQGHIVDGETIKTLSGTFREPYAMLVSVALLLAGTVFIYSGLGRIVARDSRGLNAAPGGPADGALSRTGAS